MDMIKNDLEDFGVHFDIWSYQSKIANPKAIEELLADLRQRVIFMKAKVRGGLSPPYGGMIKTGWSGKVTGNIPI